MGMAVAAIAAKIDEMRAGHQQAADGYQHAVHDDRDALRVSHTEDKQQQAGYCKHQRQRALMSPVSGNQCEQGERTGKENKASLEAMIGQKLQPDEGEQCQYKGQCRTVDGTQE